MANVKLFHVNKVYDGGVRAVKDFTLDIADKEFVVFVGPSGCGKSTTLRMIAGLEKISSGDCYIGDRLVNALPAKERNIAMVFQNYALFPNMSVYDNISYGLRMHGEDKEVIREKVNAAAQMLNLTEHLNRKPSQLSGGQRQRVALGRAIVRNPDVFLLDEPLSNLDAKLRNKMRAEIMALHRRLDATFIYVTHDQVEAMTMGDKIVVMKDGVIMQSGTPTLLYRHPDNMFVAGFLGTPQMNFWTGEIAENGRCVQTAFATFPLEGELALRLRDAAKQNGKKVIVGLRPENLSVTRRAETDVAFTAYIRVVEDFCSYGVFHGEVGDTQIVGQDRVGPELQGKTVTLYADVRALHIFDAQTEDSLLPQYAEKTAQSAHKQGGRICLLGGYAELPPHQTQSLSDGEHTLCIPADAYTEDGQIPVHCETVFQTAQGSVSLLRCGDTLVHAMGDFSDAETVGLDMSRVTFVDASVGAVPTSFALEFTYRKEKGVYDERNVDKHFCVFSDGRMETYYEFNKKMYRLGRRIFRDSFRLYLTPEDLRPAREQESYPCMRGRVERVLDFGEKCYSEVCVCGQSVYVRARLPIGQETTLAVDLDRAHVGSAQNDTMFF